MEKFETFQGIAAPIPLINVDTDMLIPKQFLKTIKRTGLGINLFHEMRYFESGEEREDFECVVVDRSTSRQCLGFRYCTEIGANPPGERADLRVRGQRRRCFHLAKHRLPHSRNQFGTIVAPEAVGTRS